MMDRYDLHVSFGDRSWKIDVKDWSDLHALARHLSVRGIEAGTTLVVPDRQQDEKAVLERSVMVAVRTSSELLREVRRHRNGSSS